MRSLGFWLVTIAFIFVSGLVGMAWFADDAGVAPRTCLATGAAMTLILKQLLTAAQPQQHLGRGSGFTLRDYLR